MLFVHSSVVRYAVHTEVLPLSWLCSPGRSVAWLLGGVRRVVRPSTHLLTAAWRHCRRATVWLWSVTDLVLSRSLFLLIFSTNLWFMINFSITLSEILHAWFYGIKALFSYLILYYSVCYTSGSIVLLLYSCSLFCVVIISINIVTTRLPVLFRPVTDLLPIYSRSQRLQQRFANSELKPSTDISIQKKKRCLSTASMLLSYYVIDCFLCFAACWYDKLVITLQDFQPTLNICSGVSESLYCFDS